MPHPALLLLHEIFPTFPSFWAFLLVGGVVGGVITLLARLHRRRNADVRRIDVRARDEAACHDGILGIPWTVPAYTLLVVAGAGVLGFVFPPAELILAPGFVAIFALALSASSALNDVPDIFAFVIIGVVSWMFWTICAAVVWKLVEGPAGSSRPGRRGTVRLDLGKKRG